MTLKLGKWRIVSLALGILLFGSSRPTATVSVAALDDDKKTEKKSKKKSKSYGASSAPIVESRTSSKVTVGDARKQNRVWSVKSKNAHQAALKQVTDSLDKVEAKLATSDNAPERAAL